LRLLNLYRYGCTHKFQQEIFTIFRPWPIPWKFLHYWPNLNTCRKLQKYEKKILSLFLDDII
jgi:hypothetical protein